MPKSLSQLIIEERDRQKLTNAELARRLKIHPAQVARDLREGYEMGIEQAQKYATALRRRWKLVKRRPAGAKR